MARPDPRSCQRSVQVACFSRRTVDAPIEFLLARRARKIEISVNHFEANFLRAGGQSDSAATSAAISVFMAISPRLRRISGCLGDWAVEIRRTCVLNGYNSNCTRRSTGVVSFWTEYLFGPTKRGWQSANGIPMYSECCSSPCFSWGIGNFAVHKAVLESRHPMLDALPGFYRSGGGRFSLWFEFVILLAAMLLAGNGWPGMAIAYGIYSLLNFGTGWLILSGRV